MKAKTFFVIVAFISVTMVLINGGTKNDVSIEEAYKVMAGTWINEEYNFDQRNAKFIIEPDGTYTSYPQVNSDFVTKGTFKITDCTTDPDGTIWMKQIVKSEENLWKFTQYEIIKISDNKATMEVAASERDGWYGEDYPDEIMDNTVRYTYLILYRQ
jgi:hypothetical protein